ncbi:type I polyketide synthase [Corynebacterium caspium]|uniref:type I polyketide synthase n=1 Tax=Corynebacterium caspium TaxID=234828 RepID=UPI0003642837|nr:type I polyketide synthase [Corynebacterium caspium]WKD59923.1 Erythronolide synthase, modules 1 and 2 [Corynebacterium caspium DSM 44850]
MSLTPLLSLQRPAVLFAGQGSPWQQTLSNACAQPATPTQLAMLLAQVRTITAPLARELGSTVPGVFERLEELLSPNPPATPGAYSAADAQPAIAVPGIVLGQIAAIAQLRDLGLNIDDPTQTTSVGHSQGNLGVAAISHPAEALALAVLLGTALSTPTAFDHRSRMLAVRGFDKQQVDAARGNAEIAVINGPRQIVLAGSPEDLAAAERSLTAVAETFNARLEKREIGGSELNPNFTYLNVAAAFHHSANASIAETVVEWAKRCGLENIDVAGLAQEILVTPFDWTAQVEQLRTAGIKEMISLDQGLTKLTAPLLQGSGISIINASTTQERDLLATPGSKLPQAQTWEKFAPQLVKLPNGEVKVQTKFSTLTGYSPIILAGMTPTTVDADIVAAATNAGHWAEMAGGGQFSEDVFTHNKDNLVSQLEPGRAAQFNSMFFDRFLWNLQFGVQRIVSKARANGAAINGVTISAGVPEPEEAGALLEQMRADGYSYITFKPGTVEQIRAVIAIAKDNPTHELIMQIEDGHSGGHHSWINLDDLLLATYAQIREHSNLTLAVGGGLGDPQRAAEYLLGNWSKAYGLPAMPVDGILVGTAAMTALEAKTSPQVKELLKDTPGISFDDNDGWVGRLQCKGGVTSGQSHLLADLNELDNDYAAASRLIIQLDSDSYVENRDEIIAAMARTAKPYFGDVETMTYAEWIQHFVDLAFPWADITWPDRFLDLMHRVEARLNPADHGEIPTLFPDMDAIEDGPGAVAKLLEAYPSATETIVSARDAAWWVNLNLKHHKPLPWVCAIDADLARSFGLDSLWQSQDDRYPAESVRAIPGPVSVAAITSVNEPVAEILDRFEQAAAAQIDAAPTEVFSRLGAARTAEELILASPTIMWHGRLIDNPAHVLPREAFELLEEEDGWTIRVLAESRWDNLPEQPFTVRHVDIPLELPTTVSTGGSPVVSDARLPESVFALLAGVAGVGSRSAAGDLITDLPQVGEVTAEAPYGLITDTFTLPAELLNKHTAVTGAPLGVEAGTPDVLVGPAWPAIYTALGTGTIENGYPVIEGLLNAVHFDHSVELRRPLKELADGRTITVTSACAAIDESVSGRIVRVNLWLYSEGELVGTMVERFAIRGRAHGQELPPAGPAYGDAPLAAGIEPGPRSFLERATITAPANMTAFAMVSGDYNPIHTSKNAAGLVGLDDALVHGMWLSACAQHLAGKHGRIIGWTYAMYGMVQLNDVVEITAERVGRAGLNAAVEVTCRINGEVVSRGQGLMAVPHTAYIYPGQGIQSEGMGKGDRNSSPAAREIWRLADRHTREALGFSIRQIIDENPTEISVRGTVFRHPQGVLNLTQFTQVALAVVAYAQTARLRENNAIAPGAMYAGHSLGEYTALASLGNIFALEGVIDIVYSRGSAMGSLVERDAAGRSNYGLAALRPNMIGLSPTDVQAYVDDIAAQSGEFLQIVNYNIPGQQYSVAGTKAGLDALQAAAAAINPRAYIRIPGIDVPFHSSVLRPGVEAFAQKLEELLPATIDLEALVDRYVPNLVARPFELTQDFIDAINAEVPSARLAGVKVSDYDANELARLLLIELLSWQFASPVRWIETQELLLGQVEQLVEVGLASSPTLTNMAERTMDVVGTHVPVFNVERDQDTVMLTDAIPVPLEVAPEPAAASGEAGASDAGAGAGAGDAAAEATPAPAPAAPAAEAAAPAAPAAAAPAADTAGAVSGGSAPDLPFDPAAAIMTLFAFQNKIRLDQINDSDTVEELTNGVSSRRNQLLMDMSAELGVPAIDGAADADVATLRDRVRIAAPGYTPFGPVLAEAVTGRLRSLAGAAGAKVSAVAERVTGTWGLPASWVGQVEAEILLGSREGESIRGGQLATIPVAAANAAELQALIDAAVQAVAGRNGVNVSLSAGGSGGAGGAVVDSAALDAFAATVTGPDGVLATAARGVLEQLGLAAVDGDNTVITDTTLVDAVEAELGSGWLKLVTPCFDARQAVLFDDRWAQAREDLARVALGEIKLPTSRFAGVGEMIAGQARWWAANGGVGDLEAIAVAAENPAPAQHFANDIALVTGAAPGSIATAIIERLLEGGATVFMTASRITTQRKEFARRLYAQHAAPGAALWLVPANLSSYRDVDALLDWIGNEQVESVGGSATVVKPALTPTLAFPFAAPSVYGSVADAGPAAENQTRLLLWSVERTIAGLSRLAQRDVDTRTHIVLPGSPNRGIFGGDGAYGEVKAAFDAILSKWSVEAGWPAGVTLAQARIGWVAGTNLMSHNDMLIPAAKEAGLHVWTPEEISQELVNLASAENRAQAAIAPLDADFTGGLGSGSVSLTELAASLEAQATPEPTPEAVPTIAALPNCVRPQQAPAVPVGEVTQELDDMVVIVGIGEVSSWGSGRTRKEAEYGINRDGSVDLTAAGVLELAWMTGLIRWSEDPTPGWYDESGAEVAEQDIYARFRDEVAARAGVRELSDKYFLTDKGSIDVIEVYLDNPVTFTVASQSEAEDILAADPDKTTIAQIDGQWTVTRAQGATARVPRRATLTRTVAGQMPDNFDPANWGIPASMIDGADRIAVWNLVTAVDAFISSGFSPAELLQAVHPGNVASTQGTGIGGMESLHQVFVSRFLGEDRPSDILQEALPNVVAAHVMQAYVGGYGSMIHPVAACATAAVSLEEGVDKIALGKADVVVTGGIDDVQVESLTGFGDMNATAETAAMRAKGISDRFISRANDRRRGGFLEAEGGGTVILARASVAAELGLPVLAVVAHAASYADGAHTSIPAPGLGALGAGRGGTRSKLAKALKAQGLSPDDVQVVSKHDTSTNANDPNESELHARLWTALGRDEHNPLFVVSQKSLTGHAKAGAALFQIGGMVEILRSARLPQNAALDCVDPEIGAKGGPLVWLRSPLQLAQVKAVVLTSLGFGHVAALVVLTHPSVFEAALKNAGHDVAAWRRRATERLGAGVQRLEAGMIGRAPLFEQIDSRRLPADGNAAEIQLLLDENARLGADGYYAAGKTTS